MTEAQERQIQQILDLDGWKVIQELLREEMVDVVEGGYEEIALNVLAKNKAKSHVNFVLNKINGLKTVAMPQRESFK